MSREKLSTYLHTKCKNVYFQPTANIQLKYPCIIYERNDMEKTTANNSTYIVSPSYKVLCISPEVDYSVPDEIYAEWTLSRFDTHYVTDNLYHTTMVLYI